MQTALQIKFRNLERSPAVEAKVREHAENLEKFCGRIMSCRVVIEASHKHHVRGNHYRVGIDLTVPDRELVANREPDEHHSYTDVYVAIRDAFDSMRRQLEGFMRRQRREVKAHATPPHGRIAELLSAEAFGRIETLEGRLVYFHRNSVINANFEKLHVGDKVRFTEEVGERGPQASTVQLVGKHHVVG
jgi:ribosomal subunit interface protein